MKFSIFNFLCLTTIVCLVVVVVVQRNKDRHITLNSVYNEISWDFRNSYVKDKPIWKNKNASPPVSLSRAFLVSRRIAEKLSSESGGDWHIGSINFVPLDLFISNDPLSWCFVVNFEGYSPIHGGSPSTFSAVILLDESVLINESSSPDLVEALAEHYGQIKRGQIQLPAQPGKTKGAQLID